METKKLKIKLNRLALGVFLLIAVLLHHRASSKPLNQYLDSLILRRNARFGAQSQPGFIGALIRGFRADSLTSAGDWKESTSSLSVKKKSGSVAFWSKIGGSFLGSLVVLFSKHLPCLASPFQPKPVPSNSQKPYFEGWFLRTVDHEKNTSFALIIGSLKTAQASNYSEHYVALSYLDPDGNTKSFHAFPSPESVHILMDGVEVDKMPDSSDDPSFIWRSSEVGELKIDKSRGEMSFSLPEIEINATFTDRQPWNPERPNQDGPEGWMSKFSFLLPCHYFVHSLASSTTYSLRLKEEGEVSNITTHGKGYTHMEANYGDSFPEGWSWAQGMSEDGKSQFILTGGKFMIGPFTTNSWVVGYRSKKCHLNYRTTDLHTVKASLSCKSKELHLVASSLNSAVRFMIDITVEPENEFSEPIYVPTKTGFSNCPGCIESYAANAKISVYKHNILIEQVNIPHSALEFGGTFQFPNSNMALDKEYLLE